MAPCLANGTPYFFAASNPTVTASRRGGAGVDACASLRGYMPPCGYRSRFGKAFPPRDIRKGRELHTQRDGPKSGFVLAVGSYGEYDFSPCACSPLAVWHLVPMKSGERIPRNNYSPTLFVSKTGEIYTTVSGELGLQFAKVLRPTPSETRQAILALRRKLCWSRAHLAALLGVPLNTVRRWEDGSRNPSAPARRLVWMLDSLFNAPERLTNLPSLLTWGKI